ncbi:MAG: gliding motility-associated C-terminal domain-containing protein [Saprospiraceae bacterium]
MKDIRSIYTLLFLTVFAVSLEASTGDYLNIGTKQQPTPIVNDAVNALLTGKTKVLTSNYSAAPLACTDNAGTVAPTINGTAASNPINFANWNAVITVVHSGGDASQDGDASSTPGFDLAIYENGPPTATGPTAALINADINYTGSVVGTSITGDITFNNTGGYQNTFNGGDPIMLWFAPITLDDHANQDITENAGGVNECTNVNVSEEFNVVFLNQIDTFNFTNPAVTNGNLCEARIRLRGGLPQWDASNFTITVTKSTAPFTAATITTPTVTHNSLLEFSVSEPGDYEIIVTDNNGATRSFTVPMNNCVVCNDAAGTTTPALGTTAASNNASFLCFGDSLLVTHDGNAVLTGDPAPATASGLGYVMYTCAPTVAGTNTVASIASDPCIVNTSGSSAGFDLVSGTDINGNTNLFNNGITYQSILGGLGTTGEIWFAPITIDDHANGGFEATGTPNECTNVNIAAAFSVIFLNDIAANNINSSMCDGSFDVTGGLPQHDGSSYSITIELTTNTLITGTMNNTVSHNGSASFTVPQPGIYRITIVDNLGCGSPNNTNTFLMDMAACPFPCTGVVNATMNITTNYNGANISCHNADDGAITVAVNGGTAPLTYAWSHDNALNNNTATNLDTGLYTVTVTDFNGCMDTQSISLTQPDLIVVDLDSTGVLCNGDMNSSVYIGSIAGGTGAYTYAWSGGTPVATGDTITGVGAGTYTVTITDANSCQTIETLILTEPTALTTAIVDTASTDCNLSANGTGTVVPNGGSTTFDDYNYTWSHDATLNDSVATNLMAGTYYVTVSDDNGCTSLDSVIIVELKTIQLTLDSTDVGCNGDATGTVTVTPITIGGTANTPYTFVWSHDATVTTDVANNLPAGTYIVTVTDALGCSAIDSIVVNEPGPIVITQASVTDVNCAGDLTGSAMVSVTGGAQPYSYAWSNNPSTFASITNAAAGTYTVTVTDATNCSNTLDLTINTLSNITLTQVDTTSLVCAGDMNGGFIVTYTGGVMPYTYAWSTNPTTDTLNAITGLGAGIYYVTVTDNIGCSQIDTLSLDAPLAMSGTMSSDNLTCATDQSGEVSIQVAGGTMPYTYAWSSNSVNNDTLTNLGAGQYFVTVTDANGCSYMDSATITAPPIIDITVTTTSVSCNGGADGTATANVTGGAGGFTYSWDSVQTGQTATQLAAGTHVLIVTDLSGCQMTDTFTVDAIPQLLPTALSSVPVSCFGAADGSATINVTGGTAPYVYTWNTTPAQDSSTAVGLSQGTYEVVVTDANGCGLSPISITVNEPQPLTIDTIIITDPLCNNADNGSIIVVPTGGTPSYTYEWSGSNENSNTNNNLFAGSYSVTVTDGNGCQTTAQAVLNDPLLLVAQLSSTPTTCNGGKDGRIQVDTVLGGVGPYSYSIDGVNFLPSDIIFFGLFGGNYDVVVRDSQGCTYLEQVLIDEPALLTVDLGPDFELDLGDSAQLQAFTNTSNDLVYNWETNDSSTISCFDCPEPFVRPTETTDYLVTVVDSNGCEASDDIIVEIDKNRRVFIPSAFSPNGDGINDRFVIFGGTGVEEIVTFQVYDRWGELVHSASNFSPDSYADGWDGSFRGKLFNPGVFVYYLEVRFSDGVVFPYKGDVTLLR